MDDLIERDVAVAGRSLPLLVPRDPDALLVEEAFEHEEYLPYWADLWPSALALAEAVGAASLPVRVLELGCGLGVPALVAALAGADALATDWAPEAVALLGRNAARAGAVLDVRRFSWTDDPAGLGAAWPLVIAADVLYERRNGPQLLDALARLVAAGGEAWIADPGRPATGGFLVQADADWTLDAVAHRGPESVTVHRLSRR